MKTLALSGLLFLATATVCAAAPPTAAPGGSAGVSARPAALFAPAIPLLALAMEAAQAAFAFCTAHGYRPVVSIVDQNGLLKLMLAADGAGPISINFSPRKAATAAIFKMPGSAVKEMSKTDIPLAVRLATDPLVAARGGGLPLVSKSGEVIGAIGVSGAPMPVYDEACAKAGVDRIKDRL